MVHTPKPVRKAIKREQNKSRKEIMSAPEKRIPKSHKKEFVKRAEHRAKESTKHPSSQEYLSKKGKNLIVGGRQIGPLRGGYDRNAVKVYRPSK